MARASLFDLAVERALAYAQGLNIPIQDRNELKKSLEVWYLKTRFVYRISLNDIIEVLQRYPGQGVWVGGREGKWQDKHTS
jgi:hypothetical protein